jgi:ABC-2 type transport system ATP-binding protein
MYVETKNLTKTIKGAMILDDINVRFESGRIYGLRGKNGSGKTMFIRAICGLIRLDSGAVDIDGKILGRDMSFPESVGVLIENPAFIPKYTGFGNLKLLAGIQNRADTAGIRETLSGVGLDPDDRRTYRKYSLGMKQRLGVACAVMEHPDIILLDEPINALDEGGVVRIKELLLAEKRRGAIIVIACHDREELEFLSDEIFSMENGKIADRTVLEKEGGADR